MELVAKKRNIRELVEKPVMGFSFFDGLFGRL